MPSMRAGTYHDGELWLRCPFCGDSETHRNKAHFSVNNSGVFHCFRCNKSGRLPMKELLRLYNQYSVMDVALKEDYDLNPMKFREVFEMLLPGPASSRYSALDRYKLGAKDVFLSRRPDGELIGLALVERKNRRVIGHRAFGFVQEMIHSSPEDPIRLVEGPYDVIGKRDVCVFGSISVKHLRKLKGQVVILCPDGDIWHDDAKRFSFLRCLKPQYYGGFGASVAGVEVLPNHRDPAEVPYAERMLLSPKKAMERYA